MKKYNLPENPYVVRVCTYLLLDDIAIGTKHLP
jgi:hypothetical protein